MQKLVSVIIPSFNAQSWLAEAIDSCLKQTYSNIEIIVIDDCSTDKSMEIIKSYGDKIRWECLPKNKGGSYARNRGFALSKGEYIQFLDADDFILPKKIEAQVNFLEETGADAVYGDWRYQGHQSNGVIFLDQIEKPETQTDILQSLLENWWTAVASLFYRRTAVEKSGGWDESLLAAQDRDFFISVVMSGAKILYQPGCYSIYRRYGNVTVSTASKPRWVENHCKVLQKVEARLLQRNKQIPVNYRHALAQGYFELARDYMYIDYSQYLRFLNKNTDGGAFRNKRKHPLQYFCQIFGCFRKKFFETIQTFCGLAFSIKSFIKNTIKSLNYVQMKYYIIFEINMI
ncbi:MAG: glycosyltransferase [Nostocaceae cyanobacterium CSU_2_110]|nr:glycosyltransferase [Nostocaceae cyanobacterium CSU_2_110]